MKTMQVRNEDLPKMREVVKKLSDKEVRRFIVDGHDGKQYWHNEYDEVAKPGISQMQDFEVIKYLREACLEEGYQIYSILEVKGNHSIEELGALPPNVISDLMRPIYYNFFDEPLETFRNKL